MPEPVTDGLLSREVMISVASFTILMLHTLDTSGTVRDASVCLQHVYFAVLDCILHVHRTYYVHLFCDTACVIADCLYLILGQISGRKDTSGVSGMDTCQLDVLHNCRNKYVLAITDRICFTLGCMMQETVNRIGRSGVTPTAALI